MRVLHYVTDRGTKIEVAFYLSDEELAAVLKKREGMYRDWQRLRRLQWLTRPS